MAVAAGVGVAVVALALVRVRVVLPRAAALRPEKVRGNYRRRRKTNSSPERCHRIIGRVPAGKDCIYHRYVEHTTAGMADKLFLAATGWRQD